jgi:hypothetical protein
MIGAIASNEFLNNGAERRWRQFHVWDVHRTSLTDEAKVNRSDTSNLVATRCNYWLATTWYYLRWRFDRGLRCLRLAWFGQDTSSGLPPLKLGTLLGEDLTARWLI